MTYLSCILTVILMLCLSKGQQIYFQNFTSLCTYINTSLPSSVTRFNNYQGQFYRLDNVTNQVKVVYDTLTSNCYLAVFQQNTSSITCRDFSLFAGNSYQLQFDHTFSFQLNSTLNVHWNADEIYTINYLLNSSFIEGIFQHVLVYLPAIVNTNNKLCFSGTSINNGTAKGPCIDNLNITLTGTAPALTPTPTPTPNSTNSTNGSSSLIVPTQNNSAVQQQPKIESYPQLAFIKQFGLSFNQISDAISFFGFSYLISNLLNFWNIIVLYYFLKLNTFIPSYRNQLLQLCSISMQQGSIFSLVHQALDNNKAQIPKKDYQKIPSSQSEWPSFNELGFTSQILLNNVETYFNLFNCIFKIFSVKIIIKLIKKRKCCASKIVSGFNVPFLDVFCYQILCSSPGMIIPFAIMSSSNSQLGFQSFDEKTNNMIHALSVQLFIICLLIPLLNKKLPKVIRPKPKEEKDQNKSILQIQSVKLTSKIDMTQTQMTRANSTYKVAVSNKQKQFIAYTKKMTTYSKQMRQKRFIFCDTVLETQNHLLFFCIPFFIGLQSLPIFFIVNIIVLSMAVVVEWKNRHIIKQFKRIQYYFGILMKFVMLVIHIFFIVVYLNQLNIIRLTIQSMSFISLTSILLIIVGALIQIMHTVVLFFVWVYEFGKKIKQNFCIKARISSQPLTKQKARTIKSTYHQRPTKGIQNIEISSVNSKDSLTQIKLAGLQKGKQNTRRISNKNNPNFIKNRDNIFNNVNQLKDSEQELKKVQMKNIK